MSLDSVPTNYRIKVTRDKSKPFVKDDDEDKNLGRWVNRQRSMFQAGKLRKDRQLALEKIGLKWSMLATTSWESMFETLCQYIEGKKKGGNVWDGNVPANYRTEDVPPRALGRWINRQRSAYGKSKLKPEYVTKLNEIGLKWSIHERRPTYHQYARADATTSAMKVNSLPTPQRKQATTTNPLPVLVKSATKSSTNAAHTTQNQVDLVNKVNHDQKDKEMARPDVIGSAKTLSTREESCVSTSVTVQDSITTTPVASAAALTQSVEDTSTETTTQTIHMTDGEEKVKVEVSTES